MVFVSEKLDGQSLTAAVCKKQFFLCSRNFRVTPDESSRYGVVAKKYDLEAKLRRAVKEYKCNLAIQMESCGPGIQGNKYKFTEPRAFVFNVYDIDNNRYFGLVETEGFCRKYDLEMVPVLERDRAFDWKDAQEMALYANGQSVFAPVAREGIVVRLMQSQPPQRGMSNMWSFKVISPEFMLKHNL
jgi:RNA ligase (TIGR02306 family)